MINKTGMRKEILRIYAVVSLLLVADMTAYYLYKISLRGYYSDLILFWFWFLGTIAIIILFWKKIMAKVLLVAMILGLIMSILPMMLPFYALVLAITPIGLRMNKDLNKNYRAQIVGYSVMAYPVLQVIEKKGILEKQVFQCDDFQLPDDHIDLKIRDAKDIIFDQETDRTLNLTLFYGGPNLKLTFDKATGNLIKKPNPAHENQL
ncbi:hypothetical protein [Pedobacter caeni]|uniref:Uncharacterized protein n=1 Tax=Pedobacter caeni TaxID=288992 RepID=A0A1M4UE48_9SPHI|nr:hypothetical protein [Pedobacter caeni]SHE55035.1 hypothetical protein SAMN04488522_101526 [Pedobacter caeni]